MKKNDKKMLNQLFTICSLEKNTDNTDIRASVILNPQHEIFEGHFPGHPVLPGVCIIHIIKEILQQAYEKKMQLSQVAIIKFKRTVNPLINKTLDVGVQIKSIGNGIHISAQVFSENTEFCNFRGTFTEAEA